MGWPAAQEASSVIERWSVPTILRKTDHDRPAPRTAARMRAQWRTYEARPPARRWSSASTTRTTEGLTVLRINVDLPAPGRPATTTIASSG